MAWEALFERAATHDVTVEQVREALTDYREADDE
jgi:hypothetical protein